MAVDVPTIITSQQLAANNYITQAQAFIDKVANLASISFPINLPGSLGFGLTDITKDATDKINGFRPVRPADFGSISAIAPTAPVISFEDIDETILDQISAKLQSDLTNGGYGIEPNDEAALWQRDRDRETQQATAEVDEVTRRFSEGGFSMPPGALFDAQDKALASAANKISSVNRDIAIKRADLYFNARKFAIEHGTTVERVLVEIHRAVTEQANVMTALYNSQIAKYRADIEGGIEVIRGNVAIYAADVSAFSAVINALGEAYRLKLNESQLNNSWNVDTMRALLEKARLELGAQEASARVQTSSATFGAQFYANVIGAALNSINTLAVQTSTA